MSKLVFVSFSLILFSLGFYTYAEFGLRKNLSKLVSCCVQARRCSNECDHRFGCNHFLSLFINACFSLVNIYHLAYLGQVLFYANSSETHDQQIALKQWSATYYSSHLIAFFYFCFFKLTDFFLLKKF